MAQPQPQPPTEGFYPKDIALELIHQWATNDSGLSIDEDIVMTLQRMGLPDDQHHRHQVRKALDTLARDAW